MTGTPTTATPATMPQPPKRLPPIEPAMISNAATVTETAQTPVQNLCSARAMARTIDRRTSGGKRVRGRTPPCASAPEDTPKPLFGIVECGGLVKCRGKFSGLRTAEFDRVTLVGHGLDGDSAARIDPEEHIVVHMPGITRRVGHGRTLSHVRGDSSLGWASVRQSRPNESPTCWRRTRSRG